MLTTYTLDSVLEILHTTYLLAQIVIFVIIKFNSLLMQKRSEQRI
jgi:hypothetical protein